MAVMAIILSVVFYAFTMGFWAGAFAIAIFIIILLLTFIEWRL